MIDPDMFDNSTNDFGLLLTYLPYIWVVPLLIAAAVIVIVKIKNTKHMENTYEH